MSFFGTNYKLNRGDNIVGESKVLAPSRSYKMTLKIKGEEYSNDLSNVRISSSLATGYQIVTLTIKITPQTILLNKLFGQDQILLNISLQDHSEFVLESMDFDLMMLNSEFNIPVSEMQLTSNQMDRSDFDILTVIRKPFETMTTMIGVVFGLNPGGPTKWTGPKTVKEMIETIVGEYTPQAKLEYDEDGVNEDQIMQCCIPPTTLYQTFKYLDSNFGVYNGAPVIFCQHDNTIHVMNLSARIKKGFLLHFEQLTTSHKDEDVEVSKTKKNWFFTYDNLSTDYVGNSKFGVIGKTLKHVVLPSDNLYHIFEKDLTKMCETYGIIGKTKGEAAYVNTSVTNRTKYYIENNGLDYSETFANSRISKEISDISRLSFSIERSLQLEKLLEIGCVVKLKTKTLEHTDIQGKYILFSSDIVWRKTTDWITTAKVELIRTNKTI